MNNDPTAPDPGWPVSGPELPSPESESPTPVESTPLKFCWRCGFAIDEFIRICNHCRAKQEVPETAPSGAIPVARSASVRDDDGHLLNLMIIAYAALLVTSVCMAGVYFVSGQDALEKVQWFFSILDAIIAVILLIKTRSIGLQPHPQSRYLLSWLLAFPCLAILLGANVGYTEMLQQYLQANWMPKQEPTVLNWENVVLICVMPGIFEELLFRYSILGALWRWTTPRTAIWTTAAMFSMAHIYNPLGMPYLFLCGAFLGYCRVRGGLLLAMILHFLHNLAITALEGVL